MELSSQPSDYSYFKSDLMSTWAGPQHWRLHSKLSKGIKENNCLVEDFFYCGCVCLGYIPCSLTTVEPLVATTTQKQPPLLNKQFAKIPKVSQSSLYLESLVSDHLLLVTTTTFRARSLRIYFVFSLHFTDNRA